MREKLYVATFCDRGIEVAQNNKLKLEIDSLCISENVNHENAFRTRKEIREELLKPSNMMGSDGIFHGPFTEIYPSAIDDMARNLARERLEAAAGIIRDLGGKKMIVHSGYVPFIYMPDWHVPMSIDFWKTFMNDKPSNFTLFIENVLDETPEMLRDIVDGVGDKRVKACVDVGHANVMKDESWPVYKWIELLGDRLGHIHVHNNYGEKDTHNALGDGEIDYEEVFLLVNKYCKDATITIESHNAEASVEWLKEKGYI